MDWDGIGTFAFFLSSGAIGLAVIALKAYQTKLAATLESARLERAGKAPEVDFDQIRELEEKVERLTERVDFTEKLLGDGREEQA